MIPRAHDLLITRWGAQFHGLCFPCAIGRGGIGIKRGEGDNITPIGKFHIGVVGYRPDRLPNPAPALPSFAIGPTDIWSDDPGDPDYNLGLQARNHRFSFEALRRPDPLYNLIGVLDFNWPKPRSGAGSAIFLHCWRKPRHPTAGCVAFAPEILFHILANWRADGRVIIR